MLKKTFWHWVVCAIAAALLLTPKAALAQQGAAVLTGTIVDAANKQPVADVVVTVTSPGLQGEQMVVTDSSGLYRIPALPPGVYTLRLEKEQYRPFSRDGINLRADSTIRQDAQLLPEALKAEEVTVVARPPSVDIGSSSTGQNISQEFTRRIPVAAPGGKGGGSRSFEAVAESTPGANSDTYGTSINGTTSPENQYVLDGMSVNNPAFGVIGTPLSMEFIKEVNIISGGYMPEYGRATGGMLNVVTKSGSNEFHGGVFGYYSPGALEGKRSLVRRAGQTVATDTTLGYIGDIGADIGGPIVKDKLWFYVGLDFAKTRFNLKRSLNRSKVLPTADDPRALDPVAAANGEQVLIPGSESDWAAESTQIQAMGKLTFAINQDNQLHLAVYATPSQSGGDGKYGISPLTGQPEADPRTTAGLNGPYGALAHKRLGSSFDTSLKWDSAFDNKRVLINTTVGWHHETGGILGADGSGPEETLNPGVLAGQSRVAWRRTAGGLHEIYDLDPTPIDRSLCDPANGYDCPVTTYNTGGPGALSRQALDRYQGRSILTYLLQGAGHHVIKAGVDVEYNQYEVTKSHSGTAQYRESTAGTSFSDYRNYSYLSGPDQINILPFLKTKTKSITAGGFLQDSWSVMDKVTLNVGLRYDAQFLYNTFGERGLSLPNQWSPRAGVIYDPTQSGRAKLFANFARFYESVPLDMADRALSGEASAGTSHQPFSPTRNCSPIVPGAPDAGPCLGDANRRVASPTPPNKYYTLLSGDGHPTPIDPNIKPQSSDEIVAGGEYEIVRDARVGVSYTKRWMNYVIEDMSRDEAATYFIGNPGYGTSTDFPKPRRDYDAVTLYFTKVFAEDWLAQASYTASYLRGNYAGLFRPETQQLDPNINSDFDLRSLLTNRDGPLPGDRTHQVKLYGAKDWILTPEHHVTTGVSFRGKSGTPTGYFGSHPQYGLDEAFILPRGSGERNPWEFGADLALGYRFQIDKDKSVQATVDIFNLFNFQAMNLSDQRYTASDVRPVVGGVANADGTITGLVHSDDGSPFTPAERNPNFGRPLAYQAPRVFRFGLRTTF
ncbi:MAG TPA: TonB-dependent receptor [Polyangiaceae bacterium]|nr:TonB-dependent receptor [Polyangiaceae bacterium]